VIGVSLVACSGFKNNTAEKTSKSNSNTINTVLGEGELIPLKSGSGDIIPNQNFIKIVSQKTPNENEIIEVYNYLSSSKLNFNYFIIQIGDYGINFAKNIPIGNVGKIDFDCAPLQSGSQLINTDYLISIENNSIKVEK